MIKEHKKLYKKGELIFCEVHGIPMERTGKSWDRYDQFTGKPTLVVEMMCPKEDRAQDIKLSGAER